MSKRRLEESGFANVLRQKPREDPILKQQIAQNTFARLMKAQQKPKAPAQEPSYKYFNYTDPQAPHCFKCTSKISQCSSCSFCENLLCQNCTQHCASCQHPFCSTCSMIDYSMPMDQIFCLSCKQH